MDTRDTTDAYDLDLSFPTLPSTVIRVEEFVASGHTDPDPLIDIIERDPSVSVNVLRRANSAYYGVPREVDRIDQAVRLLGFIEVSAIVMIEGMNEMRDYFTSHPELLRRIVHEAAFTGRFAQRLTRALDLPSEWTRPAFPAGFILPMGRLVLLHTTPAEYSSLVDESDAPLPTVREEKATFGVSHRTVACQACERWDLTERICSVLTAADQIEDAVGEAQSTLAVAIRAGIFLARRDIADCDPLTPAEALPEIQRDLIEEAAEYASEYAAEVGRL